MCAYCSFNYATSKIPSACLMAAGALKGGRHKFAIEIGSSGFRVSIVKYINCYSFTKLNGMVLLIEKKYCLKSLSYRSRLSVSTSAVLTLNNQTKQPISIFILHKKTYQYIIWPISGNNLLFQIQTTKNKGWASCLKNLLRKYQHTS